MVTIVALIFITAITSSFSIYVKHRWLDKNIFSLSPECIINNIFFWLMFGIFVLTVLYRIIKDYKILSELNFARKDLKGINSDNIKENLCIINEKFLDEVKYKHLHNNWRAFKNSLIFTKDENIYQGIDAEEFYNKENLLQEKMNFKLMNYISQLLVGIGMLGTFLGLSTGLANLNLGTDDMKQLVTLIAGTKTAFYTSLYGLYFSISISVILNIYLGYYEEKILILKNKINYVFKKYLKDEKIEEIKNELIMVRENTHELSINVGKELVKGVQEYNKSSREHLHNLTELVNTNISGLAENVSSAFEEKLDKIFSNEFIQHFIDLKEKLVEISDYNNSEIRKYAETVTNLNSDLKEIKNSIEDFSKNTLINFTAIMDRVEKKYEDINKTTEEAQIIYGKYSDLLNNSRDIILSSNQYLEKLQKVSNIFTNFTSQEEKLVEFWSNNKNIMKNLIDTLEKTKVEEINKIDVYNKKILERMDRYQIQFNERVDKQEQQMVTYYQKHLEELFLDYDTSMGKAILIFKDILKELEEKLYKIEESVQYSNEAISNKQELIEKEYKESEENYKKEMKKVSSEYKEMISTLMNLSEKINLNLNETVKIIKDKNQEILVLKEENDIHSLVEINIKLLSKIKEFNNKIDYQLESQNKAYTEEKEKLDETYKKLINILNSMKENQENLTGKFITDSELKQEAQKEFLTTLKKILLQNKVIFPKGVNNFIKR